MILPSRRGKGTNPAGFGVQRCDAGRRLCALLDISLMLCLCDLLHDAVDAFIHSRDIQAIIPSSDNTLTGSEPAEQSFPPGPTDRINTSGEWLQPLSNIENLGR
jgi:hypothetical protein